VANSQLLLNNLPPWQYWLYVSVVQGAGSLNQMTVELLLHDL